MCSTLPSRAASSDSNHLQVKTDDSFQFARAVKRLRQAIEALGDVTGRASGDALDARIDDSGREASLSLSLERKKALIEVMKETFKSYHLAWARSSIEPAFKVCGYVLPIISKVAFPDRMYWLEIQI